MIARREQRIGAFGGRRDDDVADRQPFLDLQREHAVGADVDVGDVRGQLAAEADLVVVAVDLEDVLLIGLDVEDLARGRVHQRQQRVGRDALVAFEPDRGDDRVLDHAVGDRDAVGPLLDDRRRLIGEEPEIGDRAQILLHDGRVERVADLRLDDGEDAVGGDVRVAGHGDRDHGRSGRRGIRRAASSDRVTRARQARPEACGGTVRTSGRRPSYEIFGTRPARGRPPGCRYWA